MGLNYENLTYEVRQRMLVELDADLATEEGPYLGSYLNEVGCGQWPELLRQAVTEGSDESLARSLGEAGCFKVQTERRNKHGGVNLVAVPSNAADMLAEGQFNTYYMRALASLSVDAGADGLQVYRARHSNNPRPESEAMIGNVLAPGDVLAELRRTKGVNPEFGVPQPNSGLSLRL